MSAHQLHESQNVYDNDDTFWGQYSEFPRMKQGLDGASEWPLFRPMLPSPLQGLRVLDLGCGDSILGCYAAAQGASRVLGVDLSERMLERAAQNATELVGAAAANGNTLTMPTYGRQDLEDLQLVGETFDLVVSGLALHYVADFKSLAERIFESLSPGGCFVFSVEHPMLTAPVKPGFLKHSVRAAVAAKHMEKLSLAAADNKPAVPQTAVVLPDRSANSSVGSFASFAKLQSQTSSSVGTGSMAASLAPSPASSEAPSPADSEAPSPASSVVPSRAPTPAPSESDEDEVTENDTFWPVESYFTEGDRHVPWLGASVLKQHRTTATYFGLLKGAGFEVYDMAEWGSTADAGRKHPDWPEGVTPRFLILGARKPVTSA
ncbi:hypothetical protein RB597_002128 [Gaeumannomyces tritici]